MHYSRHTLETNITSVFLSYTVAENLENKRLDDILQYCIHFYSHSCTHYTLTGRNRQNIAQQSHWSDVRSGIRPGGVSIFHIARVYRLEVGIVNGLRILMGLEVGYHGLWYARVALHAAAPVASMTARS